MDLFNSIMNYFNSGSLSMEIIKAICIIYLIFFVITKIYKHYKINSVNTISNHLEDDSSEENEVTIEEESLGNKHNCYPLYIKSRVCIIKDNKVYESEDLYDYMLSKQSINKFFVEFNEENNTFKCNEEKIK